MKHLSIRTLIICALLPPALYVLTLQGIEIFFQNKCSNDLQLVLISDADPLLIGRLKIEDVIRNNIDEYLDHFHMRKWGVLVEITFKTYTGRVLYPPSLLGPSYIFELDTYPRVKYLDSLPDRLRIAENNWRIMSELPDIRVDVKVLRNSWLANGILAFYILAIGFFPFRAYRATAREVRQIEFNRQQALKNANEKLMTAQQRLTEVSAREAVRHKEIVKLRKALNMAGSKVRETENEALAEMERLEKSLQKNIALKEDLELEVLRLEDELNQIESARDTLTKKQRNQVNASMKRFKILYKNLEIHSRAVEGFLNLENDLQLRAEELIHNMNEDSRNLPVKRKVFSRKGAPVVFECEFGYKGRIYWRPGPGTKTQIFAIGTKNTQTKDLAYLEGV